MDSNLTKAIDILKRLPEKYIDKALIVLDDIKTESDKEKKDSILDCPHCKSSNVKRNGKKRNKQAYFCNECKKSYIETTKNIFFYSHYSEAVWKQVIRDTVEGVAINDTAASLDLHHETVFNMRHKILYGLEEAEKENPTMFQGICEMDETYVLESHKGTKLSPDYWREPRRHGAKAEQRGLSNEYICICAGIHRDGDSLLMTVNRATASSEDISKVFANRIDGKTVILTDGAKGYNILGEDGKCAVFKIEEMQEKTGDASFFNINTVNGLHSFIKERVRGARGFATKYTNRYNTLFSKIYRTTDAVVDDIYNLLCDQNDRNHTIKTTQTKDLLNI
jgi:transposase-like protein